MTACRSTFLALLFALLASGCASVSGPGGELDTLPAEHPQTHPDDPWEGINRGVFAFNETLDAWLLKPVAKGYDTVMPGPLRVGVSNFFGNLGEVWVGTNNLLQGKPAAAASDFGRFVVNSTMGIGGLIDVASPMGLEKHTEDFGQTLAVWGAGSGPYVVLPVFGSRTTRDSGGLVVDLVADVLGEFEPEGFRQSMLVLRLVDARAELLPAEKIVSEAALDKYSYFRSAYLQRRRHLIFDGNPPREDFSEE